MDAHPLFAISLVATAPSPATSGPSLVTTASEGARFGGTFPLNAVICPASTLPTPSNSEVVRITARSTDTLTITRTQEGSSARSVQVGDVIYAAITPKSLTDIETALAALPTADGWIADTNTWTFVSSTTGAGGGLITYKLSAVDATGYLKPGTKVSWNDATNTPGFGIIATATFSTDTTVTLIRQSDYVMANHAITAPRYSYAAAPVGFPTWFNYNPTVTGWSVTNAVYRWTATATAITVQIVQTTPGTSTATAHTMTLPVATANVSNLTPTAAATCVDNGGDIIGFIQATANSTTLNVYAKAVTANNTASGNSAVFGSLTYQF